VISSSSVFVKYPHTRANKKKGRVLWTLPCLSNSRLAEFAHDCLKSLLQLRETLLHRIWSLPRRLTREGGCRLRRSTLLLHGRNLRKIGLGCRFAPLAIRVTTLKNRLCRQVSNHDHRSLCLHLVKVALNRDTVHNLATPLHDPDRVTRQLHSALWAVNRDNLRLRCQHVHRVHHVSSCGTGNISGDLSHWTRSSIDLLSFAEQRRVRERDLRITRVVNVRTGGSPPAPPSRRRVELVAPSHEQF